MGCRFAIITSWGELMQIFSGYGVYCVYEDTCLRSEKNGLRFFEFWSAFEFENLKEIEKTKFHQYLRRLSKILLQTDKSFLGGLVFFQISKF